MPEFGAWCLSLPICAGYDLAILKKFKRFRIFFALFIFVYLTWWKLIDIPQGPQLFFQIFFFHFFSKKKILFLISALFIFVYLIWSKLIGIPQGTSTSESFLKTFQNCKIITCANWQTQAPCSMLQMPRAHTINRLRRLPSYQ